jgi:hypothetical protein
MAASLRATVLPPYKSGFVPFLLTTIKLKEDFEGGSSKDKKCPVFTREHIIKALLYIDERFRKIASCTLELTTGQNFLKDLKKFSLILL